MPTEPQRTLVIFTYAPAGFGHLRVADALKQGLPKEITNISFSPVDTSLESIHRFTSQNVVARHIMEWIQHGLPQVIFTKFYRHYLKTHTDHLTTQFSSLIGMHENISEKVIVVSTHFGFAHQLGSIKEVLEKKIGAPIILAVQVTDDSPQDIWYVDTADVIFVPSEKTKATMLAYGKREKLKQVEFKVLPYPINPILSEKLADDQWANRLRQLEPNSDEKINIVLPVSGAAIGMMFFEHLIKALHEKSDRFVFHIVCRKAPFTEIFLQNMSKLAFVKLHVSESYEETVTAYDKVYMENVIAGEVTKPSEQAFKSLLSAKEVGGSFLFFAEPVGRQEFDNVAFMKRHGLLAENAAEQRGAMLPFGSKRAAEYIWEKLSSGYLLKLYETYTQPVNDPEVRDDGVKLFWEFLLLGRS